MKKAFNSFRLSLALLLSMSPFVSNILSAQVFQVDTILYNGNPSRFINFVFLGDGFQSTEFASYASSVQASTNYLFSISPFAEYKNYFNVFSIQVPSVQSGADHPGTATDVSEPAHPVLTVNTYFNSTFDVSSIHRLLVANNSAAINNVVITNFPQFDQKLILVNSPYYGGSGGTNAAASLHGSSNEIMVHEIGHSFAGLQDEYWSGLSWETANMTQQSSPALVRWTNWIGVSGVGVYQHCCGGNSATWYHPSNNCKMRSLNTAFCPVCKETILEKVHQVFGTPILSYLPLSDTLTYCSQPIGFSISTVKPIPNTLRVSWFLNGNLILMNNDSITIQSAQLINGSNILKAEVLDTTLLSRLNTHPTNHTNSKTWTIQYNPAPPVSISPTGNSFICQGDSLIFSASPAVFYQWNTGEVSQTITVVSSGTYDVYINGCIENSDTVSVTVNANPIPIVAVNGSSEFCTGDSVNLSTGIFGSYLWSNGDTTQNIIAFTSGNYFVSVTDSNGCRGISSSESIVENSLPIVNLGNDTSLCGSCTLLLDAENTGAIYAWNTGASTRNILITSPGVYWVMVTDSNGCSSSDTIIVDLFVGTSGASIYSQPVLSIFPNPSNGFFTLEIRGEEISSASFYLFSLLGNQLIISGELEKESDKISKTIDLSSFAKGIYIGQIVTQNSVFTRSLILR